MVDWNGLFKWSMKYHHEDTDISKIKPMDKETQEWLTKAMEEYTYDEVKRMKEIVDFLVVEEKNTEEDQQERYYVLDELLDLTEGLENARTLAKMGGLQVLMNIMFNSIYIENKKLAMEIFISCNQNNAQIQHASIELGGFNLIKIVLDTATYDIKLREWAFASLSSMVRGEHLDGKRQFISAEGVQFLLQNILESDSQKIKNKALVLLKDMVIYDDRLHLTKNNTENFANTNAKQTDTNMFVKKEEEKINKNDNELEENKEYKDMVKKTLIDINFIEKLSIVIFGDQSDKQIDFRAGFAQILAALISFDENTRMAQMPNFMTYKKYIEEIIEINKKNEELNADEIIEWMEVFQAFSGKKEEPKQPEAQAQAQAAQQQEQAKEEEKPLMLM